MSRTMMGTVDVLFVVIDSVSLDRTLAVFDIGPPEVAVPRIVMVTVAPLSIVPMVQATVDACVHEPCVDVAEISEKLPGSGSVTATCGGLTFSRAVMAGTHTTGGGAFGLRLDADGDNVWVAFVDNKNRIWTAGSRDGGRSLP